MIVRTLTLVFLIGSVGVAEAQRRPPIIPSSWVREPDDSQGLGRRYFSPDGTAWLVVYGSPVSRSPLRAQMDALASGPGERITYQRRTRHFIAVSGYKDDRIFYRKSNLACGGKRWHHIALEYPRADRRKMDAMVTHIAHGMNGYDDDCPREASKERPRS